jgi:hypothetical protein
MYQRIGKLRLLMTGCSVVLMLFISLIAYRRNARSVHRGIQVHGSKEFQARTRAALELVSRTRFADLVPRYVSIVRQAARSGMRAYEPKPTYEVGEATWKSNSIWYASTIVHDAVHSRLYHEAAVKDGDQVPLLAWTGQKAERICLQSQLEALQDLDAEDSTITYVRGLIENPEYAGDESSWTDYQRRNW